ncbi:uncharacterized protein LOC144093551 [Amblyomma americanum]
MPNNAPLAPQPPAAPLVCSGTPRQRDPAVFSGLGDSDVEDWLASYERVSTHNRWDDAMKLNNVIFYLADVANLWFRNHEAYIATWSTFKTSFTEVFGRPGVRKLRAEQRLRERAQQPGETFTSYIEDVVDLCKRVNSDMTEADKIQNIMKGIDEDAFQMPLAKQPATVASVISLCQSYEELRKQRVLTRRTVQPADVLSADVETAGGQQLRHDIQKFIREEIARQLALISGVRNPPPVLSPTLQQTIRAQVAEALPPLPQQPVAVPLTYAAVLARPPSHPLSPFQDATQAPPPSTPPPDFSYRAQVAQPSPLFTPAVSHYGRLWRTRDNRPICFACGFAGHVARYCRRRPSSPADVLPPSAYGSYIQPPRVQADPLPPAFSTNRQAATSHRSSSPRRRSLSPMSRRASPSAAEN